MAQVVYTRTNDNSSSLSSLFNGQKFWLSARVPMKRRFAAEIKANGGEVVQLEKQADMIIVDHKQKDIPANSFSYTFIDRSIRNGVLENAEEHRAAPNTLPPRQVGSVTRAPKATRIAFTPEDDRFLLDWMNTHASHGTYAGNTFFQDLGQANTRHPWQAWRDRYIKRYRNMPPANAPPTPPAESVDTMAATNAEHREDHAQTAPNAKENIAGPPSHNLTSYRHVDRPLPEESQHVDRAEVKDEAADQDGQSKLDQTAQARDTQRGDSVVESGQSSPPSKERELAHSIWLDIVEVHKFDLPNKDAIANILTHFDSALNIDVVKRAEAWMRFSECYGGRSAAEWEKFWHRRIKPFHRKYVTEFQEKYEVALENPIAESDSANKEILRNLTYEPRSPGFSSVGATEHEVLIKSTPLNKGERSLVPPIVKTQVSSIKRAWEDAEDAQDTIYSSSQPMPLLERSPKRRRLEPASDESDSEDQDIFSTPRKQPDSNSQSSPIYPTLPPDSDSEEQKPALLDEADYVNDYDNMNDEDNDMKDYDAQMEYERGDEVSRAEENDSLEVQLPADTGFDTQGKVDAQIFADLRSHSSPSRAGKHERESSQEGSTIAVEPELGSLEQWPKIHQQGKEHKHDEDVEEEELDKESWYDQAHSGREDAQTLKEPSPESGELQNQRRQPQQTRLFKPAAFITEDSPQNSGSSSPLFIRTPTPPPRSSPPPLLSSSGPEDQQGDTRPTPPTSNTSSSGPTQDQDTTNAELDAWVDGHVEHGHSLSRVQLALMSTSGDPDLADAVLEQMKRRNRDTIPGNMEGVWTEADDECLESEDPKMLGVVMTKHGAESVDQRYKFLRNLRGEGSDE